MGKAIFWLGANIRMIILICIPLLLWQIDYKTGGDHFTFCLFKNITGKHCYGCGLLRGVSAFLHLDFKWAFKLNPLNIITVPLLVFVFMQELVNSHNKIAANKLSWPKD